MFKKILCPVDLKDLTNTQLKFARGFAADQNATLSAIYVTQPPLNAYGYLLLSELEKRWDLFAQRQMMEFCGDDIEILIRRGSVGTAVAETAKSGAFDLLMIPTHGHREAKHLFLGSTFQAILNASSLPLMALPPRLLEQEPVEFRAPERILCAIDIDPSAAKLVEIAGRIAKEYGAKTSLLHSIPVEERILNLLDSGKRKGIEQRIQEKLLKEIPCAATIQARITTGSVEKEIIRAVTEEDIDLLILGFSHSHFRLRTVLYRTIVRLSIPCLCIPLNETIRF